VMVKMVVVIVVVVVMIQVIVVRIIDFCLSKQFTNEFGFFAVSFA
jgi:hypothetical protein